MSCLCSAARFLSRGFLRGQSLRGSAPQRSLARSPAKKIAPQKSKVGLPNSSHIASAIFAQPCYDWNVFNKIWIRCFNRNPHNQKSNRSAFLWRDSVTGTIKKFHPVVLGVAVGGRDLNWERIPLAEGQPGVWCQWSEPKTRGLQAGCTWARVLSGPCHLGNMVPSKGKYKPTVENMGKMFLNINLNISINVETDWPATHTSSRGLFPYRHQYDYVPFKFFRIWICARILLPIQLYHLRHLSQYKISETLFWFWSWRTLCDFSSWVNQTSTMRVSDG